MSEKCITNFIIAHSSKDKLILPVPKSPNASRTRYLFHPSFDWEKGFGRLTGAAWIRCFWFGEGFDQAVADAMTSIEGFLNREVVSQGTSAQEGRMYCY